MAALWPNYRIAPLTAVIVLLTPGAQQLGPVDSAIFRSVEITLGSFVGLGVSLVLLPARAHGLVISTAARALSLLADLLGDWLAVLAGGRDRTRITKGGARTERIASFDDYQACASAGRTLYSQQHWECVRNPKDAPASR